MSNFIRIFDGLTSIKFPSPERALNWLEFNGHQAHYTITSWSGGVFINVNESELRLMDLGCIC